MKTELLFTCSLVMLFFSCSKPEKKNSYTEEDNPWKKEEQTEEKKDEEKDLEGIDADLFKLINMNYPGLETMKDKYLKSDFKGAAAALLDYYHKRTIVNPEVDLSDKKQYTDVMSYAEQGLVNRFYTMSYYKKERNADGSFMFYDHTTKEGGIDWDYIPAEVSDKTEYNKQIHRLMWMPFMARAFNATGNEKYIKGMLKQYWDYLEKYPIPEGKGSGIAWTGLQISIRLLNLISEWPYLMQSTSFDGAALSKLLVFVNGSVECILKTWYLPKTSNIYFSQVQALTTAAIFFPEFKNSGNWITEGANQTTEQLTLQFNPDGGQNECDIAYHQGVLDNFVSIQRFAVANGTTGRFPSNYTSTLHNSCRYYMDLMYPEYKIENFNDSRSSRQAKSTQMKHFVNYSEMFPDDKEMLWMATDGKQGTKPTELVQVYPYTGWYALRTEWGMNGTMFILKNNNNVNGAWHCQSDNGTFALWKGSRRFFPDAGSFSYTDGPDRAAFARTSRHNTMTENNFSDIKKANSHGQLILKGSGSNYEYVVTENQSYDDLSHRRSVFMVNRKFFVILDEGYGPSTRDVNLSFHLSADPTGSLGINATVIDDFSSSFVYGAHTVYPDGNNMLYRTFAGYTNNFRTASSTSWYSDEIDVKTAERRCYSITVDKKADKAVRFITVIYPFSTISEFNSTTVNAVFTDNTEGNFDFGGASIKVTVNGTDYNLSYSL